MIPLRSRLARGVGALALLGAVAGAAAAGLARRDDFDHELHRKLFTACEGCHAGVRTDATPWPDPAECATCHDGEIEERTDWAPPELPRTNLRFSHPEHFREVREEKPAIADSAEQCATCHIPAGGEWMQVHLAKAEQCLDCHELPAGHFAVEDTRCAECHVPLPEATRLLAADVAEFPEPPSHEDSAFITEHGTLAEAGPGDVPFSCSTCHARDFCAQCHVNAPEVKSIQALAPDARSLAIRAELAAPPSHRQPGFLNTHGRQDDMATCAFCHTRESCTTCHVESAPRAVTRLASAGGGRGVGAVVERRPPDTHGADFSEEHASIAEASPRTCASCHARAECLECHIPGPGAGERLYHDAAFLTRHPAAAYARETSCADCHNTASFCASCHEQSGLVATGPLRRGYHDASPTFVFGHGQAARQSLESCTACHAERDCLTCHSAEGGRRFNPHGPGFDPERLRRKNPEMCSACHGAAIPG